MSGIDTMNSQVETVITRIYVEHDHGFYQERCNSIQVLPQELLDFLDTGEFSAVEVAPDRSWPRAAGSSEFVLPMRSRKDLNSRRAYMFPNWLLCTICSMSSA